MGEVHHLKPPAEPPHLDMAAELAAEVIACLTARPDWNWLVRRQDDGHAALVASPDYRPLQQGVSFSAIGRTPGEALREARLSADRAEAANAVRPDGRA